MDVTTNLQGTRDLGGEIASLTDAGAIIALSGPLGAGKTTFVQGFCGVLNIQDYVTSPTFTLINIYHGKLPIYHVDLYRLDTVDETFDTGLEEYLPSPQGITIIEWADKFLQLLPADYLSIKISYATEETRKFSIEGNGDIYKALVKKLYENTGDKLFH